MDERSLYQCGGLQQIGLSTVSVDKPVDTFARWINISIAIR